MYVFPFLYLSGMDPLAFAVLCGVTSGVVGFLLGGATFKVVWKFLFRRRAQQMQEVNYYFVKYTTHNITVSRASPY